MRELIRRHGRISLKRRERREVKHLSTCRKRYSVSSGERKRRKAKPLQSVPLMVFCSAVAGKSLRGLGARKRVTKVKARGTGLKAGPQRAHAPYS